YLRGMMAKPLARIYGAGLPVDTDFLRLLYENRDLVIKTLIQDYDKWGFFVGGHLSHQRLEDFQRAYQVPWERTGAAGRLKTDDKTLKTLGGVYPAIEALRFILKSIEQLRGEPLPVGPDGRHRFASFAFTTITGRTVYLARECILVRPHWMRGLIQPQPG